MNQKTTLSQDPFEILKIPSSATQEHIKHAFRALAMRHHPDKGGDPETFARINTAYETLTNPEKFRKYKEERYGTLKTQDPKVALRQWLNSLFQVEQ